MDEQEKLERFEQSILPHLDAAYNLARWLSGSEPDAQDIVQEACLRAFRFFNGFRGGNSRSWLLRIVRNTFYEWLKRNDRNGTLTPFDELLHEFPEESATPDAALLQKTDRELLLRAIAALPVEFRESLVLRELEGLSYKEIADLTEVPLGTVMSRLARAREQLRTELLPRLEMQ